MPFEGRTRCGRVGGRARVLGVETSEPAGTSEPCATRRGPTGGGRPERHSARLVSEEGSAVVDFVLVGVLVIAVALALIQLALGLHVRNVVTDAAGEGARRAALVGGTEAEAEQRVRALTGSALTEDYVDSVTVSRTTADGVAVVQVDVTAPVPVLGLLGPGGTLHVTGHAVDEAGLLPGGSLP